jgi:hypothetical protein
MSGDAMASNSLTDLVNLSYADPALMLPESTNSSDMSIIARKTVELSPREGNAFGGQPAGSPGGIYANLLNKAVFNISDGSGYISLKDSYLTGTFRAIATTAGDVAIPSCLDKGGLHACISEIRLKLGNAEIFRQTFYNKAHNAQTMPVYSEAKVDFHECRALDSIADFGTRIGDEQRFSYTVDGSGYVNETKVLTLVAGDLTNTLRTGDVLRINGTLFATVLTVASATTCTVSGLAENIAAINSVELINGQFYKSTRARVVNSGAEHRFTLKLDQQFMRQDFLLPLPFMLRYGALEMEIFFEDAVQSLVLRSSAAADNKIAYRISDLKLHASMLYPSAEVLAVHEKAFAGKGIKIPYTRYDTHLLSIAAAGQQNFNIQSNKNSIQRVLAVMCRTDRSVSVDATNSQINFSQSTFNKLNLQNYQFKIGSQSFPDFGNIEAASSDNWLTWNELQDALTIYDRYNKHSAKDNSSGARIRPHQWAPTTSDKFILGTAMSKDGSFFSGQSARLNNVQLSLNVSTVPQPHTLIVFMHYDCLLEISQGKGVLIYE